MAYSVCCACAYDFAVLDDPHGAFEAVGAVHDFAVG